MHKMGFKKKEKEKIVSVINKNIFHSFSKYFPKIFFP